MMPASSWGTWPAPTSVPERLPPIVDVMECIELDRVESTHTPCSLAEHDPLVDIAVMRSTAERA